MAAVSAGRHRPATPRPHRGRHPGRRPRAAAIPPPRTGPRPRPPRSRQPPPASDNLPMRPAHPTPRAPAGHAAPSCSRSWPARRASGRAGGGERVPAQHPPSPPARSLPWASLRPGPHAFVQGQPCPRGLPDRPCLPRAGLSGDRRCRDPRRAPRRLPVCDLPEREGRRCRRTGWIPAEAGVAVEPAASVAVEGWLGTWKQAEAQIG